jgi:tetratricopeptide (TPR) repeat protein
MADRSGRDTDGPEMRWRSRLYIFSVEGIAVVIAAAADLLTNVITNEPHIKTLVLVGLGAFLLSSAVLQGVRAVVAERKSRAAERAIARIEETAREIRDAQLAANEDRAEQQIAEALNRLPRIFGPWIKEQWRHERTEVSRVIDALNEPESKPPVIVSEWQANIPEWIGSLGWRALLVAGELANAYGAGQLSVDLILAAVAAGSTRESYWTARAALLLTFQRRTDIANSVLTNGNMTSDSPDQFARIVFNVAQDNKQLADSLLSNWTPEASIDVLLKATLRVALIFDDVNDVSTATPAQFARGAAIYRNAVDLLPYSASVRISLATLLISSVSADASTDPHRDLQEAQAVAIQARNICRSHRASSVQAVELACQAAWADRLPSRVIEIGTAVTGDASPEEASSNTVQFLVAVSAVAKGHTEISNRLIPGIIDPFQKAYLLAISAEAAGHPSIELWRNALDSARVRDERVRALIGLAQRGENDLPGLEDIRTEAPHEAALIEAVRTAATGDITGAIRQLRAIPGLDINVMMTLADVYISARNVEAAVDVLREASRITNDPRFRVDAAQLLWGEGLHDRARAELETLLVDAGNDIDLRHDGLIMLGQWASEQSEWIKAQDRYQELLALDPSDAQVRWAVILVMLRRGLFQEARTVYDGAPTELTIEHPDHARAWMATRTTSDRDNDDDFVEQVITAAGRFAEDENVQAEAIFTILSPDGIAREPLSAPIQVQFNHLCERFFTTWPNSTRLRRYSAADINGLVSQMEELIRPTQQEKILRAEVAEKLARNTLPWAFLSAMTGRPYSEIIVVRAGGVLPAQHIDKQEQQMCRDAVYAALDKNVAVDISAAAVIAGLPSINDLLIGQFERIVTSEGARRDVVRGIESLRSRSTSSWAYDEQNDRGHLVNISQATADSYFDKAQQLAGVVSRCRVIPVAIDAGLAELQSLATESWATVVQCAVQSNTAFWCDDVALRAVARNFGVASFSTPAFLEVLVERGVLTLDQRESAIRVLVRTAIGDFPLSQARLGALAAESVGTANAVASIFSRASTWVDVSPAFQVWTRLIEQVGVVDNSRVADWLHAGVIGITRLQKDASIRREAAAFLLGAAAWLVHTNTGEVVRCVAAARAALAAARQGEVDDDPLRRAVEMIRATMIQQFGLASATTLVRAMFDAVEASDRLVVLSVLYG